MTTPTVSQCIGMNTFQTYLNDKVTAAALASGKIYFYSDINRTTLKDVYMLSGSAPNYTLAAIPNPNTLNSDGTLSDGTGGRVIPYFYPLDASGNAESYYITVYNSANVVQETLQDFPPGISSSPASVGSQQINYIQNPQFLVWDHIPVFYGTVIGGGSDLLTGTVVKTQYVVVDSYNAVCDGWWFQKDVNATVVDQWSQQQFTPGQTTVEGSPQYYLQYDCTSSAGGTYRRLVSFFSSDVSFLNGQTVTFSIQIKADTARSLKVKWYQNFGSSGGSLAVLSSTLATIPVTASWNKVTVNFTVPSISGKVISGTSFSNAAIVLEMDYGTACQYSFCNMLLIEGTASNPIFQPQTYAQYRAKMDPIWRANTGDMQFKAQGSVVEEEHSYWILMQDQTIGNGNSGATAISVNNFKLFCVLYSTYADTQCPVSGGRTGDPVADWNANKTIRFPLTNSRLLGAAGSGAGLTARIPGVTGGGENVLKPHVHTYTNGGGHVAGGNKAWGSDQMATNPSTGEFPAVLNGPGQIVADMTETDTAGSGTDTMNPFSFLQLYIHS